MPLPKPTDNEEKDKFISRCMGEMSNEYPKQGQRYAVCLAQWERPKSEVRKMEQKTFKFEIKSIDEEKGILEGIATAYRKTPDKVKDIVQFGACKKTLSENPEVPSFFMHDPNLPIGVSRLNDGANGVSASLKLIRGVQKAEETLLMAKAGLIKTFSIGYDVIHQEIKAGIRYLTEIKIREVSVVVGDFAADDLAVITSVKTDIDTIAEAKDCIERLQALLKVAEVKQEPPTGTPATDEDKEAAQLNSALDTLIAEAEGFNAKEAEARIDAILAQI